MKLIKILSILFLIVLIFSIAFSDNSDKLSFTTSKNSYVVWNSNYLILSGKATVTYKKTTIVATSFFYDIKNNTFYITSQATFLENKDIWNSKKMAYDVNNDEIYLFDTQGQSKQKNPKTKKYFKAYYFSKYIFGDIKDNKRQFTTNNGYFTTCDPRKPHFLDYKIKASKIYIYPNDHLIAYNVIMYIGMIPVYYFPFYYFPLNGNARQPIDFSYKMDDTDGVCIHIGLNYNLGGEGKDGGVYYDYIQKKGTMTGIDQDYYEKDLKFNFKYDIKTTIDKKSSNWFQLSYSQKPWNLFNINTKFMTSNSSDSSVFNTGKIQKYLNINSLNQPFRYSLKLSSIQNVKYEKPSDNPTSAQENTTGIPTTTVNDSQILPQITFNYSNSKHSDFSLSSLSFLYKKIKNITTTTTPQSSNTVKDYYTSTLNFNTAFSLPFNMSVGYRYSNNNSNIYTKSWSSSATTTETSSSIKNYLYLKHSFGYLDSYVSYEDNIVNDNPYKLLSANFNLKYKLNPFSGNLLTKFGKTLTNDKYTFSLDFNNNTPFYKFTYKKTLSDIAGLPQKDEFILNNNYRNKYLQTKLNVDYVKKVYNLSYMATSENINFYLTTNLLRKISIESKINYDFIKKEAINPYVYSSAILNPFYIKLRYYMNNDLSFYKLWLYSRYYNKNFLLKNANFYIDFSTFVDSNYQFGQSKVYLKYNIPKIMAFSASAYYYPDRNIWDNFLFSSSIFFIPGWSLKANASYVNRDWSDFKLSFVEDLSCWNGFGSFEYSKYNGVWKFKQFTIGLYIKAFPKKPYSLDPVTGKFEIGGF